MPVRNGFRKDLGQPGFTHIDKRLNMQGASWVEPTGGAILFDDFIGGVIDLNRWDVPLVQDTSGTAFAYSASAGGAAATAGVGGWIVGITGTGDDDTVMVVGPLSFKPGRAGNGLMVFEAALNLPVITTVAASVGFHDAITYSAAGLASITTTVVGTVASADGAYWIFDTDQTTDVWRGIGSSGGTDSTFGAAAAGTTVTADIPFRLRIEVDSGSVGYFYMNAPEAGNSHSLPLSYYGAVAGCGAATTAVAPGCAVTARAGTDNLTMEVDYILAAQAR